MKLHVITFLTIPYLGLTHVCVKSHDVSMREHSWVHCQAWNTRTNCGGDPELLTTQVIQSYSGPRQYSGEGPRWNPGCCSFSTMVGNHAGILGVVLLVLWWVTTLESWVLFFQYYDGGPRWNPGCCSFSTMVGDHVGILNVFPTRLFDYDS